MRRGRWAAVAAAAAVFVAAGVSAGCGGGSALSLDPVASAATKTQQAGAARLRLALAIAGPRTQGRTVRLTGSGAIDGTSSELSIETPAADTSFKEISLEQNGDYLVFLQVGSLASRLPSGKHWIELDVTRLGGAFGLAGLLSSTQISPSDVLSMLKAEGSTLHNLGAATVDGTATTHYRITIDVAKALQASGETSPLLAGVASTLSKVPVDVWVGKDNLLRRIAVTGGSSRTAGRLGLTMDIYDYGAHVTIAAPPKSDVFDVTKLALQRFGTMFAKSG